MSKQLKQFNLLFFTLPFLIILLQIILILTYMTDREFHKAYAQTNISTSSSTIPEVPCSSIPSAFVTVTCYYEERDQKPDIGAFNTKLKPGTIAVSRDLLSKGFVPFSSVYLEGFGMFIIADVMHKRFVNRVDIWVPKNTKLFKKDNIRLVGCCPTFQFENK